MAEPLDIQALGRAVHEVLILSMLRGGGKHGYQIALDVERETAGVFAFRHGTLYPILHRLEREGRIAGRWDRGEGRRRKVYEITGRGESHLEVTGGRILAGLEALRELMGGSR